MIDADSTKVPAFEDSGSMHVSITRRRILHLARLPLSPEAFSDKPQHLPRL